MAASAGSFEALFTLLGVFETHAFIYRYDIQALNIEMFIKWIVSVENKNSKPFIDVLRKEVVNVVRKVHNKANRALGPENPSLSSSIPAFQL